MRTTLCSECGSTVNATVLRFPAADGTQLDGVLVGSGPAGVVLLHQHPAGLCGFWPYAVYLSKRGLQALAIDLRCYGKSACPQADDAKSRVVDDVAGAVAALRARGAKRIALVGASLGASTALLAGAALRPPVGPNLSIMADTLVDRQHLEGSRVAGVLIRVDGQQVEVAADRVVLAAGAYGSPAVLLRSGVGSAEELTAASIEARADLPGVGRNLVDHPALDVWFRPGAGLLAATAAHYAADPARAQSVIRAQSQHCAADRWDLHIVIGVEESEPDEPPFASGERLTYFFVCALKPESRERVRIRSADPEARPAVEHGFLTDRDGHDVSVLVDGVRLARRLAASKAMSELCEGELAPGPDLEDGELQAYARRWVGGYWHPVGTCKMGPETDPDAVVDHNGCVHGFDNLFVADASVMPTIPRANTHLPVLAVAERIAEGLRRR